MKWFISVLIFCSPWCSSFADTLDKKSWAAKAARTLRYDHSLTKSEWVEIQRGSKVEILDYLMDGRSFTKSILDFSLFFLHQQEGTLPHRHNAVPEAWSGALKGFEHFFSLSQPNWVRKVGPIPKIPDSFARLGLDFEKLKGLPDSQVRGVLFDRGLGLFMEAMEKVRQGPDTFCAFAEGFDRNLQTLLSLLGAFEISYELFIDVGYSLISLCGEQDPYDQPRALRLLESGLEGLSTLEEVMPRLPKSSNISDALDVMDFNEYFEKGRSPQKALGIGSYFWAFQNNSTNFNRLRGAMFLQIFFCDQLTPIGIVLPDDHMDQGGHGDNPACRACHYKLDPMAGFFKNYGLNGFNFSEVNENPAYARAIAKQFDPTLRVEEKFFAFDDLALLADVQVDEYMESWRNAQDGSWNIGLIRSSRDPRQNSYGESLEDLFTIVNRAPEVSRCLTTKVVRYLLGDEQMVDRDWLLKLAHGYHDATNKTEGLKQIMRSVALSQAFQQSDPDPNVCYDSVAETMDTKPSCEVSGVLHEFCSSCHNQVTPSGGLRVDGWVQHSSGQWGFDHRNTEGRLRLPSESFALIKERLGHGDPRFRMPLGRAMPAQDTEALLKWIESF